MTIGVRWGRWFDGVEWSETRCVRVCVMSKRGDATEVGPEAGSLGPWGRSWAGWAGAGSALWWPAAIFLSLVVSLAGSLLSHGRMLRDRRPLVFYLLFFLLAFFLLQRNNDYTHTYIRSTHPSSLNTPSSSPQCPPLPPTQPYPSPLPLTPPAPPQPSPSARHPPSPPPTPPPSPHQPSNGSPAPGP